MKSPNCIRFHALNDIIDAYNTAFKRGDEWYKYCDRHFAKLEVYNKIGAISEEEFNKAFDSLNHCFSYDCEDLRPYFLNLLNSLSLYPDDLS